MKFKYILCFINLIFYTFLLDFFCFKAYKNFFDLVKMIFFPAYNLCSLTLNRNHRLKLLNDALVLFAFFTSLFKLTFFMFQSFTY
jgi:hypothetical protein